MTRIKGMISKERWMIKRKKECRNEKKKEVEERKKLKRIRKVERMKIREKVRKKWRKKGARKAVSDIKFLKVSRTILSHLNNAVFCRFLIPPSNLQFLYYFSQGFRNFSENATLFSFYSSVSLVSRVFANVLGDRGSIPGRVIQKTPKNSTWYRFS